MSDSALKRFHERHHQGLQDTAKALRDAGIARIYFGLNFYNDEGDAADYAVVEYTDGRTETLPHWHPLLDMEVFVEVPYCNAYVFDAQDASVKEDLQGGLIDVAEGDSRAYHTPEQREEWELLAEELPDEIDIEAQMWEYNIRLQDGLEALAAGLTSRGIARMYFGVDAIHGTYPMSDYAVLHHTDGRIETLGALPDFVDASIFSDLPQYGAFVFDAQQKQVSEDLEGSFVFSDQGWARAYHTPERQAQLEALLEAE